MLGEPPEDWTLAAAGYPPGCVEFRRIIDYVPWWRRWLHHLRIWRCKGWPVTLSFEVDPATQPQTPRKFDERPPAVAASPQSIQESK